jgi:multiple sugar transport system ATP-binding protein
MGRITLSGINRSFGRVDVLHDVNLDIADGEFVVFVGPSGCGKSTLLRLIAGLDRPTSGTVAIDGRDVTFVPAADRGLAMVFQSYALYPHMSVRQNLAFGLENAAMPRGEIDKRIAEAARMLGIAPYLDRRPGQLSGGQKQRVAIGRAVVRNPTAFLLDEPLSNLDAELRITTRAELAALHKRLATTMIYVTHDQIEAMTLADRIVVLRGGRVEQVGRPMELYDTPANLFVAGFIGSPRMNLIPAVVRGYARGVAQLELPGGAAVRVRAAAGRVKAGDKATLGIRPQNVRVAGAKGIKATVRVVEALGSETVVHGEAVLPGGEPQRIVAIAQGREAPRIGDKAVFALSGDHLLLFDSGGSRVPAGKTR